MASPDEDSSSQTFQPLYIHGGPSTTGLPRRFSHDHSWLESHAVGLSETIDQMGFTQAAVLVDGTLGSSAVATLVTDALGPTNVHALLVTGANDRLDASARKLVENLRLPVRELPMAALSPDRALAADLAKAHLAALAREEGAMPLSNLDKTAMALETMPGMLAPAGLAPLGDVYRSTVLDLVHTRNTISPVISRDSCRAFEVPAIPGVEECGPTPEQRLGFVDYVLASHIEWARALSDIADIEGHPQVVSAILDRLATCQPGRMSCCLVIVMSTCTLDDAPWPLGMAWRDRPRTKEERAGNLMEGAVSLGKDVDEAIAKRSSADTEGERQTRAAEDARKAAAEKRDPEQDMRGVVNLLRDLSLTGGLAADQPDGRGRKARSGRSSRPRWNAWWRLRLAPSRRTENALPLGAWYAGTRTNVLSQFHAWVQPLDYLGHRSRPCQHGLGRGRDARLCVQGTCVRLRLHLLI